MSPIMCAGTSQWTADPGFVPNVLRAALQGVETGDRDANAWLAQLDA